MTSTSQVFAQGAIGGSAPQAITCPTNNPLAPVAGIPYIYSADVSPLGGSATWFATTDENFITAGAIQPVANQEPVNGNYVQAATNYQTAATVSANPTQTSITWGGTGFDGLSANGPADPAELFVVVSYESATCANNLKVFPIRPINAFTVDIRNWDPANTAVSDYGDIETQCFDDVQEAVYNPTTQLVDYDFGTNVQYFEVIAANFTDYFTPTFQISGVLANQTALVEWGYTNGTYPNTIGTITGDGTTQTVGTIAQVDVDPSVISTANGVSIYVRVTISNNDYEGLAISTITLAVDAVNAAGQDDVATDCTVNPAFADAAVQTLDPRPTVTAVTPTPFNGQVTP